MQQGSNFDPFTENTHANLWIFDQLAALFLRHSHLAKKTLCPLSNQVIAMQLYGSLLISVRKLAVLKPGSRWEEANAECLCVAKGIIDWLRWQPVESRKLEGRAEH